MTGPIVLFETVLPKNRDYALYWDKWRVLDALATTDADSMGHFANSPSHDAREANAKFAIDRPKKRYALRATRAIKKDEEILVCYGTARTKRMHREVGK